MVALNSFNNETYTVGCIDSENQFTSTLGNVSSIMNNYTAWANRNDTYLNIKYSSFEIVSTVEYPYRLSAYCKPVDSEINTSLLAVSEVFVGTQGIFYVLKNFSRYFGSILVQMTQIDDCFLNWDGTCLG